MSQTLEFRTVRPHSAKALHGLANVGTWLLAVDPQRGYLLQIDPATDNTLILNAEAPDRFRDVTGLALWGQLLWCVAGNSLYTCDLTKREGTGLALYEPGALEHFMTFEADIQGVAVAAGRLYITCAQSRTIEVLDAWTGQVLDRLPAPGAGLANLTAREDRLWVCDRDEQTVYGLDRHTGAVLVKALTPYPQPTGLTFVRLPQTGRDLLYVAYAGEEPYLRDDPNSLDPLRLDFRPTTFIHPLHLGCDPAGRYCLSNGYRIEMAYVEEIAPLEDVALQDIEWRIALPADTPRQKLRWVEPVGLPFTEEVVDGQRIAVFKLKDLHTHQAGLLGWRAEVEVYSIKYQATPERVEPVASLPPELAPYLVDDDDLTMDSEIVQRAAREAVGSETNWLRKVLAIRNYVYDRLSYRVKSRIDSPDETLRRGTGSCGEYVGVLLALLRLNGIPCRTAGRYKCPQQADQRGTPLFPQFNHVWVEFYLPGYGWLPMESNTDDIKSLWVKPTRFFMGLAWYHMELGKGVRFEDLRVGGEPLGKDQISLGDLAINHIRFVILEELIPPGDKP